MSERRSDCILRKRGNGLIGGLCWDGCRRLELIVGHRLIGFMLAPVDLRTSDAVIAKEMASGRYPLADKVFEIEDKSLTKYSCLTMNFSTNCMVLDGFDI
ncbi:hypothetical protein RT723_06475, partial [Psychrosphaera aquimarina]